MVEVPGKSLDSRKVLERNADVALQAKSQSVLKMSAFPVVFMQKVGNI